MSILSIILYILKKKVKKPAFKRLKLKAVFFYMYSRSSKTSFFSYFRFANILNNATIINICVMHGKHEVMGSNPTRANFLYGIEKPYLNMNTIYIYIYIYIYSVLYVNISILITGRRINY